MGCVASSPQAEAGAVAGRSQSDTTRARRLSLQLDKQRAANGKAPEGSPPGSPSGGQVAKQNTRTRRLSYVTNDKNLADKIRAEYGLQCEEDPAASGALHLAARGGQGAAAQPAPPRLINVQVACMSRAGREPGYKKTNQDNCFAFEKYIDEDAALFGTMDGHGPHGHLVSGFVKQHLPILLVNHISTAANGGSPSGGGGGGEGPDPPGLAGALHRGFHEVDAALAGSRIDCEFSGCTCVVAYLQGRTLHASWVGDSRCVVGRQVRKGWEAVEMTNDHKPTTPEEKARIQRSRGRVERLVDETGAPIGPHRVWLEYAWIPGLAMSRALGDQLAHQVGVISTPDHSRLELGAAERFIILASDGVWEFITNQEAVEIVGRHDGAPEEGCRALVDEAYQRWLTEEEGVVDDVTAIVVSIRPNAAAGSSEGGSPRAARTSLERARNSAGGSSSLKGGAM